MSTSKTLFTAPAILSLGLMLSGCASTYTPIVDMQGVDPIFYEEDLAACRAIADQVDSVDEGTQNTLIGSGVGAALGAAVGAITGAPGTGAAIGATTGAFGGATSSANNTENRKKTIINNCLRNRGYIILG